MEEVPRGVGDFSRPGSEYEYFGCELLVDKYEVLIGEELSYRAIGSDSRRDEYFAFHASLVEGGCEFLFVK